MPKNKIGITQTSAGFCSTYSYLSRDKTCGSRYLTPLEPFPSAESTKAGYVPFTELISAISNMDSDFYAAGVDLWIDRRAQKKITTGEKQALRSVVHALERMARDCQQMRDKISKAKDVLK